MRRLLLTVACGLLAGCSHAATVAPPSPTPSSSPVFGVYKPIADLCTAVDYPGDPVSDHSEKSNYLVYTCTRGGVTVTALYFTSVKDAVAHYQDVQANVTGAAPVSGVGAEAFSAGSSLWAHDANLVLSVRFKTGGSAQVAADLARKSLPRLRSAQ